MAYANFIESWSNNKALSFLRCEIRGDMTILLHLKLFYVGCILFPGLVVGQVVT